jgi:O-antigen ligase
MVIDRYIKPILRDIEENTQKWVRPVVIAGVIFFSFYLAPLVAQGNKRYRMLFLGYGGLVGLLVLLRWPIIGILGTILGAYFVPFQGPGGFNSSQIGLGVMLVVWLMDMIVREKRIRLVDSRTIRPLLIFILVSLLSFGFGQFPWYPLAQNAAMDAQLGGLAIFILSAGAYLMVGHLVRDLRWLRVLMWMFLAMGGVYIFGRMFSLDAILSRYSFNATANAIFWIWMVALAFGQAVFNTRLHPALRVALVGLVLGTFYVAYVQAGGWKSGWLPPLAVAAVILALRFPKLVRTIWPLAIIPVWITVAQAIASEQYSWGTRLEAWMIVTEIAKVNPILGLGFANYYWYTPLFLIRGYSVVFNSHSQFVDLIAQTGILGLVMFLWFFGEVGVTGWKLRERVPKGFPRAYVYGALGGLA